MKIIGISGKAGSGKDTVGRIIRDIIEDLNRDRIKQLNTQKLSFASNLKDICVFLFGWDRDRLEHDFDYKEGNTLDDGSPDPACEMLGFTRRQVMQKVGTEAMRKGLHRDVWIICMKLDILAGEYSRVDVGLLTDCRFKNELEFVRDMGGTLIRVDRSGEADTLTEHTDHQSETDWLTWEDWDYIVQNDIDPDFSEQVNLNLLRDKLELIVSDILEDNPDGRNGRLRA